MSDYTSGQITFAGLGNGTDFDTLIEGLVDVERQHINRLESWKADWELKVEKFQDLNSQMLSLKTTLQGMDSINEFLTKTATSNNTGYLTASADSDAIENSHTVSINQLAQNDILLTASGTSSIKNSIFTATSNFSFSYGGEKITLSNISAGTTMGGFSDISDRHALANGRVRASYINGGDAYDRQLYGMDLGADNQLVLSNTGSMVFSAGDFGETQNAQNSQIKVDGFPSAASPNWIERSSNTITDVIDGLTLNLKEATGGGTVKVTVDTDYEAVKENVRTFVDQVNEVRKIIKDLTDVDATNGEGSVLTGNYGVQMISQNLKNITASKGIGFEWYNDSGGVITGDLITSLSQLGITTDAEEGSPTAGMLVLDEDVLDTALKDDPNAAAELFAANYVGESRSPDFTYLSHIDGTTKGGTYDVQVVTDGSGIASATINGHAAKVSGWEITGMAGYPEAGLAFRLDNHTLNTTFEGQMSIKVGKTVEMVDELKRLTSTTDGPLKILEDNYEDIMDSIDDKIIYEENRIELMEQRLRERFARLDTMLGYYDQLSNQLANQLAQLE